MRNPKKKPNAFLCHCHKDRKLILALCSRLKKDGVDVWLDNENLLPGQDWEKTIRKAILNCDAVIVCLSRAFNKQGGYRHEELKLALEKSSLLVDEVFIIPVRLEKCDMLESLRHLHRVDLFEAGGYKKLVRALKKPNETD